jgi:hypothetical protein
MMQTSRLGLRREKMSRDEIIAELVELVLMQEKELQQLNKKLNRVKQYIEVYEEYIEGIDR